MKPSSRPFAMRSSTTPERDAPPLAPLPRARDRAPFADAFAEAAGRLPPVGAAGFVAAFDVVAGVSFVVALAGVAFATAVPFGFAVPTFAVAAFTGTFGEVAAL